ncbi:MAG: LysR family transcriptional regulator [Halieaceae bacterium]|nr:LysR family transcriptional regulator [Halieaceae bacterium]MCP4466996.1 LysR family transcriptional regulator [Halieaceae bacterium]MCP4842728.1 LysR family transcriptional regulator [Halieaceae bacterium]
MKFTLRQLQIFLAVAKHQNISRAAQSLHMSQSAASEALLNLEHTYQVSLFDRISNKLALNAIGQTLRREAEYLLTHCQSFEELLLDHTDVGHLKVGASFTIGNHLATRYLAGYLAHYPEADVALHIANTPDVVAQVLNFDVDIGMIEGEVHHRDLELIPWREDELIVFCAADHPLAKKKSLTNKDIREAPWILREPDSGARQTFDRALAGLLPSINIYLELKHNEAIKNAVESGLGIGCLSQIVLQKNFANGDLVPLTLPRRNMRRRFYFAQPRKRYRLEPVEYWMKTCREMDRGDQ